MPSTRLNITINGLRHYFPDGMEELEEFQRQNPPGSVLSLHLNGNGHPFPGSVSAETEDFREIGTVSLEDIYRVRPLFGDRTEGGTVEALIVEHGNTYLIASVPDQGQCQQPPYMRHIEPAPGEPCLTYTRRETLAQRVGDRLEQLLGTAPGQHPVPLESLDPHQLLKALTHYLDVCCQSLAADDLYQRRRISNRLLELFTDPDAELSKLSAKLYEQINDFKHAGTLQEVYEAQIADIMQGDDKAFLTRYYATQILPSSNYISSLIDLQNHVEKLLEQDTMGHYRRLRQNRKGFIVWLFYSLFDRQSLYLILGRLMVIDDLTAAIDGYLLEEREREQEMSMLQDPQPLQGLQPFHPLHTFQTPETPETLQTFQTPETPELPETFQTPEPLQPLEASFTHTTLLIVRHLVAQCPAQMDVPDPDAPGRMHTVTISIDEQTLATLLHRAKTDWQDDLLLYIGTRKHTAREPFSPSTIYILLGWLCRHTRLFGLLPKKHMATLLCQQEGCRYKPTTMETYLTKATDDEWIYDDYPLMRSIRQWMQGMHPGLWTQK